MWVNNQTAACKAYGHISSWDTGNVTDMFSLFAGQSTFNDDISGWNVSGVTDMNVMFNGASKFNSDLHGWDVSRVTNMHKMFLEANTFNGNLSDWNVTGVTQCYAFARGAPNITCPPLKNCGTTECPTPSPEI